MLWAYYARDLQVSHWHRSFLASQHLFLLCYHCHRPCWKGAPFVFYVQASALPASINQSLPGLSFIQLTSLSSISCSQSDSPGCSSIHAGSFDFLALWLDRGLWLGTITCHNSLPSLLSRCFSTVALIPNLLNFAFFFGRVSESLSVRFSLSDGLSETCSRSVALCMSTSVSGEAVMSGISMKLWVCCNGRKAFLMPGCTGVMSSMTVMMTTTHGRILPVHQAVETQIHQLRMPARRTMEWRVITKRICLCKATLMVHQSTRPTEMSIIHSLPRYTIQ